MNALRFGTLALVAALSISTLSAPVAAQSTPAFRTYLERPLTSLDPLFLTSSDARQVGGLIYEGLVATSPVTVPTKGGSMSQVVPSLAESWEILPDRKTYVFKLRKGVRFHNGRLVRAADVKYSLERAANPTLKHPGLWAVQRLNIKGLRRYQAAQRANVRNPHLVGVEILDNDLVQVQLEKPIPYALELLSLPYFSVVAAEDVERWWKPFAQNPIGTGPYKLAAWEEDQSVTLQHFSHYHRPNVPGVPQVKFSVMPQGPERFKAFTENKLDHVFLPADMLQFVQVDPTWNAAGEEGLRKADRMADPSRSRIFKMPRWKMSYISMDNRLLPFNDRKVRQAFNYAINKQHITDQLLDGYARPMSGIYPPGFPGSNRSSMLYTYNADKARKLLFEAGWRDRDKDGFIEPWQNTKLRLTLKYQNNPSSLAMCKAIQANLKEVGVKIDIAPVSATGREADGQFPSFYHASWTPELLDPSDLFYPTFHSRFAGTTNTSRYANAQVDQLIANAENLYYEPRRYELYEKIENTVLEDAPWLFLYNPVDYYMIQPHVQQYVMHPMLPAPYQLFQVSGSDNRS